MVWSQSFPANFGCGSAWFPPPPRPTSPRLRPIRRQERERGFCTDQSHGGTRGAHERYIPPGPWLAGKVAGVCQRKDHTSTPSFPSSQTHSASPPHPQGRGQLHPGARTRPQTHEVPRWIRNENNGIPTTKGMPAWIVIKARSHGDVTVPRSTTCLLCWGAQTKWEGSSTPQEQTRDRVPSLSSLPNNFQKISKLFPIWVVDVDTLATRKARIPQALTLASRQKE